MDKLLAMGLRKPPSYILTDIEIEQIKVEINSIEADESVFIFNSDYVRGTCYRPQDDKIHVRGNVLRDPDSSHPRDLMSERAVLAHEYYGHRPYRDQYLSEYEKLDLSKDEYLIELQKRKWADEFRASYMAAKNTPELTDEDRRNLILDALERAKEAGVNIKHNDYIRRAIHGTDEFK